MAAFHTLRVPRRQVQEPLSRFLLRAAGGCRPILGGVASNPEADPSLHRHARRQRRRASSSQGQSCLEHPASEDRPGRSPSMELGLFARKACPTQTSWPTKRLLPKLSQAKPRRPLRPPERHRQVVQRREGIRLRHPRERFRQPFRSLECSKISRSALVALLPWGWASSPSNLRPPCSGLRSLRRHES
jgi:hypothetical protein